jgi:hypothetical protein
MSCRVSPSDSARHLFHLTAIACGFIACVTLAFAQVPRAASPAARCRLLPAMNRDRAGAPGRGQTRDVRDSGHHAG